MNKELELKIIERKLKEAKEELIIAQRQYENAEENLCDLQNKLNNYKIKNNLIHPMADLKKHIGEDIRSITLVEKLDNGDLIAVNKSTNYLNEEIVEVNERGYLHYHTFYSSVSFDEKLNMYSGWDASGNTVFHDYVGFLDIELFE